MRRLTREEILTFVNVLAVGRQRDDQPADRLDRKGPGRASRPAPRAGRGPVPDPQRHRGDPALRAAVDQRRAATSRSDVELYGQTVPAGSAMMLLRGSANRDHRRLPARRRRVRHPPRDRSPPRRSATASTSAWVPRSARLEGRIALDEVLNRFPEWEVDLEPRRARLVGRPGLEDAPLLDWLTLGLAIPAERFRVSTSGHFQGRRSAFTTAA